MLLPLPRGLIRSLLAVLRRVVLCTSAMALAAAPALAGYRLYGIGSNIGGTSDFYEIIGYESGTPVIEVIGDTGKRIDDLAIDPTNGRLYGVEGLTDELYEIDPSDGSLSLVGDTDAGTCGFVALEFDPSGQLWGWCGSLNRIWKIDKSTGAATQFAITGVGAASGDLAFDSQGRLWGTNENDELVRFDLSTFASGTLTPEVIGDLDLPDPGGSPYGLEIDFADRIYLGEGKNTVDLFRLWRVNPTNAQLTLISDLTTASVGLFGLSFDRQPEPIFASGFDLTGLPEWDSSVP